MMLPDEAEIALSQLSVESIEHFRATYLGAASECWNGEVSMDALPDSTAWALSLGNENGLLLSWAVVIGADDDGAAYGISLCFEPQLNIMMSMIHMRMHVNCGVGPSPYENDQARHIARLVRPLQVA